MQKTDFVAIADVKLLLHTPAKYAASEITPPVSLSLPKICTREKQDEKRQL
jgi:hypothetical protein